MTVMYGFKTCLQVVSQIQRINSTITNFHNIPAIISSVLAHNLTSSTKTRLLCTFRTLNNKTCCSFWHGVVDFKRRFVYQIDRFARNSEVPVPRACLSVCVCVRECSKRCQLIQTVCVGF